MTQNICGCPGDREETLIAYLYDDIAPAERAAFESHLASCARCEHELEALGRVRAQLATWAPPEPRLAGSVALLDGSSDRRGGRQAWWREMPAWAQVAAAMLFLGASARVANLDVRYDQSGLSVRTGSSRMAAAAQNTNTTAPSSVTREDLAALERQLRTEFHADVSAVSLNLPPTRPAKAATNDGELTTRLKALIEESERRQQRELALRVAEVVRDVSSQRQADLRKIDQNIGMVQSRTGVEVLRQREMLNYIAQRVSQKQ